MLNYFQSFTVKIFEKQWKEILRLKFWFSTVEPLERIGRKGKKRTKNWKSDFTLTEPPWLKFRKILPFSPRFTLQLRSHLFLPSGNEWLVDVHRHVSEAYFNFRENKKRHWPLSVRALMAPFRLRSETLLFTNGTCVSDTSIVYGNNWFWLQTG